MKQYWGKAAAGFLFAADDGRILLLARSAEVYDPGLWGIPGGRIDGAEGTVEGAVRETAEECGPLPPWKVIETHVWYAPEGTFKYTTFVVQTPEAWAPTLNWENDAFAWLTPHEALSLPDLHPGVRRVIGQSRLLRG